MSNTNCHDVVLRDIARRFLDLAPFPDASPERAAAWRQDGKRFKHVFPFPGNKRWGVRYFISGRDRFMAFARPDQLDDALRFADVCTYLFWRYRQRKGKTLDPGQFNISIEAAAADADDWRDSAPEILGLIREIEDHFLYMEIFSDLKDAGVPDRVPDVHSKAARRTLRGELRSVGTAMRDALLDIAAVHEKNLKEIVDRLDDLCERMDAMIETRKITWGVVEEDQQHPLLDDPRRQYQAANAPDSHTAVVPPGGTNIT